MVSAGITITINEDQTYTYESTNQDVSSNRSGTWTINGDNIVLEGDENLKYWVLGNDYFMELQGSGFMFTYQNK